MCCINGKNNNVLGIINLGFWIIVLCKIRMWWVWMWIIRELKILEYVNEDYMRMFIFKFIK